MAHETCENCGSRVYKLGCVNCDEEAYISQQEALTTEQYPEASPLPTVRRRRRVDREQLSERSPE